MNDPLVQARGLIQAGKAGRAERELVRLLRRDRRNHDALQMLGQLYLDTGKPDKALGCFQQAIDVQPANIRSLYGYGNALKQTARLAEAAAAFEKAIGINDGIAEIHNNLASTLFAMRDYDRAERHLQRALAINSNLPQAHLNLGNIHLVRKEYEDAQTCFQTALAINPNYAEALNNLGDAYLKQHRRRESIQYFERAVALAPGLIQAHANLLEQQEAICDWRDFETRRRNLEKELRSAVRLHRPLPVSQFQVMTHTDDPLLCKAVAEEQGRSVEAIAQHYGAEFDFSGRDRGRLRLGYMSCDFRDHPVGQIVERLFQCHDKENFDVVGFSIGWDDGRGFRQRIAEACTEFIDLEHVDDREAARRIHAADIDILIDLNGFTEWNRMEIFGYRPAPIQVSYLGFPGTTGLSVIDYILGDATVTPLDQAAAFTENIVALPNCYLPNGNVPPQAEIATTRRDWGLPEDTLVFCSFCNSYKIDPEIFDVWMDLLKENPDSVLWLATVDGIVTENLRKESEARGVSPDRLVFAERMLDKTEHLARLAHADIAFDTRRFNGHQTTMDALFAGLPLVSSEGRHFPSRVSASMLRAAGLAELITSNIEEYAALARRLAADPALRQSIRDRLLRNRESSPLFDTAASARSLEAAYREMWRRYAAGERPRAFAVADIASAAD